MGSKTKTPPSQGSTGSGGIVATAVGNGGVGPMPPTPEGFSGLLPIAARAYDLAAAYAASGAPGVGYYGAVTYGVNATGTLYNGGSIDVLINATNPNTYYTVAAADAVKLEGTGGTTDFTFTITRNGDLTGAASIDWTVLNWGTNAADYAGGVIPSGTAQFADGQATQTIIIAVAGDAVAEVNEQFAVAVNNSAVPAGMSNWQIAIGQILNDDTTYSITAGPGATVVEGTGGTHNLTFTVTRTGIVSAAGTVDWSVAGTGSSPVNGADFVGGVLPSGTLAFAAGETTKSITIPLGADLSGEANETFTLNLANPSGGATIAVGTYAVTVTDDDVFYIFGTTKGDTIAAPNNDLNAIVLNQGGNDKATGGNQGDLFLFGSAFTASDTVNGGAGRDILSLNGDYAVGVILGKTTLTNVEGIYFTAGNSYKLTTNDATIGVGGTLVVDASALGGINGATVNGAAETNGSFQFLGGAGNDAFTGGALSDLFVGGLGADVMAGGNGADIFRYTGAADSALQLSNGAIVITGDDTLNGFQAGVDRIDLAAFHFAGALAPVLAKAGTGFSTDLTNATGFFGTACVAVEYAGTAARVYVDVNKDGNLGAGDMLIQVNGAASGSINGSSFVF